MVEAVVLLVPWYLKQLVCFLIEKRALAAQSDNSFFVQRATAI